MSIFGSSCAIAQTRVATATSINHIPPAASGSAVVPPLLQIQYARECRTPSDINQHLPTLFGLATECTRILACVAAGASSVYALGWGLSMALPHSEAKRHRITVVTPSADAEVSGFVPRASIGGLLVCARVDNHLTMEFEPNETFDLVFIDTWHVYGQLKRELARFAPMTNRFIVLHDTQVDGELGETLRVGENANAQSVTTGIPLEEIICGVTKAVTEFLTVQGESWEMKHQFANNNGLTVLQRRQHA